MLSVILKTLLGLLISALGFFLGYFYLSEMEKGCTPLLLVPAFFLICLGVYILIKAGNSEETVIKKSDMSLAKDKAGLVDVFNKNNALSSKWAKTVEKRDRLKLLEISGAAEEQG